MCFPRVTVERTRHTKSQKIMSSGVACPRSCSPKRCRRWTRWKSLRHSVSRRRCCSLLARDDSCFPPSSLCWRIWTKGMTKWKWQERRVAEELAASLFDYGWCRKRLYSQTAQRKVNQGVHKVFGADHSTFSKECTREGRNYKFLEQSFSSTAEATAHRHSSITRRGPQYLSHPERTMASQLRSSIDYEKAGWTRWVSSIQIIDSSLFCLIKMLDYVQAGFTTFNGADHYVRYLFWMNKIINCYYVIYCWCTI